MNEVLDARFREGFASWRRMLAAVKDIERRGAVFENAVEEVAGYVVKGLDKVQAVDRLHEMALGHGLIGHWGEDGLQARIAHGFEHVEDAPVVPDDWGEPPKGNGQRAAPEVAELDEWNAGDDPGPIPPREWLLGNQFCRGFISSLVAAGGVGKSALGLLQFVSLALGRSLCAQHVFDRCRVLLISLEDDKPELQRRLEALLQHFQIARSELDGWLFCATPKRAKLAELKDRNRIVGPLEQQIRRAVARRKPDVISLDPYVKVHGLNENDSGDMDFVCNLLARLAVEHNVAVDSPHHVHKGLVTPGDADSGRGSTGIRDAGRLIYTLAPMSEDEAKTFGIDVDERHSYIRLDAAKVNIAARSGHATWFHLIGVPIGNATAKYPAGDTVQVAEPWSPPETWADVSLDQINKILNAIDAGIDGGNYYTAGSAATARAAWKVVIRFAPDKTEGQARQIINTWVATGVLEGFDYENPDTRKPVKGLKVSTGKRPGNSAPLA